MLAEDVRSDVDMPPFHKAMMDGFAVVAADTRGTPVVLPLIEEIPAGRAPKKRVTRGSCSRIMTGAPMPRGADAVVQVEHTEPAEGGVRILRGVVRGKHVAPRGEDARRGRKVLSKGHVVRAAEIGILATVGRVKVRVYRRPTCAVLVTGDELVAPGRRPGPGQIRNSNGFSLSAQLREMGLEARDLGVAGDDRSVLRRKIRRGLKNDVLVLSGGISAGKWDLVIPSLEAEGVRRSVYQVLIKPGRPFFVGTKGRTRVFAMPGNPVSAFVIFEVFVLPFLRRMMGWRDAERPVRNLKLGEAVRKKLPRMQYLPARIENGTATPLTWHGSADLFALADADGFVIVPIRKSYRRGARVGVMMLESQRNSKSG